MKKNLRARSKNKKLNDLENHLDHLGIDANKESLKQRIRNQKSIAILEGNADKKATKMMIRDSDDEDD